MTTLAIRLAGPLSSWGEQSRFLTRATLDSPTRSALLGLARAALGHGRKGSLEEVAWLFNLDMALRIDNPGALLRDYHTVNPRVPALAQGDPYSEVERSTLGTVPTGSGRPWGMKGTPQTLVTERYYRQDVDYLWLIEGDEEHIEILKEAFEKPTWAISLGRKKCIPDWLFLLGTYEEELETVAALIPRVTRHSPGETSTELQLLTPNLIERNTNAIPMPAVSDIPQGPHPHDGYLPSTRNRLNINVPTTNRAGLIDWIEKRNGQTT